MLQFGTPLAFFGLLLIPFILKRKKSSNHSEIKFAGIPFSYADNKINFEKSWALENRNLIISCLQVLTWCVLILALSRPQLGEYTSISNTEGRDLIITVDASGSMKALDFKLVGKAVSRLEALKSVVHDFIDARKGDRIGLIVFGQEVFTQCPLTSDHILLKHYLDGLEIGMAGDSTALGDALALSVKRIKDIPSKSKAIILVTDGLKTSGQLEPVQAAEIAKRAGVKVHTIGIGGKAPAPFPVEDMFGRTQIGYLDIPVDDESLIKISEMTGGKYFSAQKTDDLIKIYSEIDKLETRKVEIPQMKISKEYFFELIFLALILICLNEFISRTWLRVIS